MRRVVIGVMGAGDNARPGDVAMALELGEAIARENWVLLSGGRNAGIMDAVNRGAKKSGGLTIGVVPGHDKRALSDAVDVGIVTGMGSARNYINVLSSDVVVACGQGGAGTASEIALALKSSRPVILLNDRPESQRYFAAIGGSLVHATDSVAATISTIRSLLDKS
ncbi:MAG: uncharacterized protein OJF62_002005 [Pseudolabrys sp.]|nr:uncharacterized protein [Pseudolabrys sp.]